MAKYYFDKYYAVKEEFIREDYVNGDIKSNGDNVLNWLGQSVGSSVTILDSIISSVEIAKSGETSYIKLIGTGQTVSNYNTFYKIHMYSDPLGTGTASIYLTDLKPGMQATVYSLKTTKYGTTQIDATLNRLSIDFVYSRGALYQSDIIAEDGTYPTNGRHTDGYWYVRKGVSNTAPTTPRPFTQPSGTLEIGDAKVISWGAATDAESNLKEYVLEQSINGGVWTQLAVVTTTSVTHVIQTATSIKFRVKARDTAGLESAYRESGVFTVTKPTYYWSKYNSAETLRWSASEVWIYDTEVSVSFTDKYRGFAFDPVNNKFSNSGSKYTYEEPISIGDVAYLYSSDKSRVYKFVALRAASSAFEGISSVRSEKPESVSTKETIYSQGILVQSGITAVEGTYPTNGRHTDSYWYVRGARVNASIAPSAPFTAPTPDEKFKPNEVASIVFGASIAPNLSLYEVDYRYNNSGAWTPLAYNNTLTRSLTITTDKALKTLEIRVRAKNTSNVYSDYVYSELFEIEHNVAPTMSLTGPEDNATLYENDILNIAGTAFDADADQSVTVYYQINNESRKVLATNLSQTQISLSKQLTFKGSKLYDGETALTSTLADGVAHTLKVWAEDSEKVLSAIVERTFYVVPNRAPLLSVDAVVPSGVVDVDKFKISGTATDQDANSTLKVTSRINAGNAVEIYSGSGGAWEFDLALSQLVVGQNTIVIEVIDNYGAKTSKTVTLNKKELKTPILQSVARYKIEPPKGSAKGVLLFIQRDEELDIKVELSMTASDEQEQYETLTPVNTAPVQQGLVEDTFEYEGLEAKQNIILKITPSRTDLSLNHKIHLISGAVD